MRVIKKNKMAVIIIAIFFLAIGFVFFKYKLTNGYAKVNKNFESALVIEEKVNTDKTINIQIVAKMIQGDGVKSCESRTELSGSILIDNKKYELRGARCTKSGSNNFICIAKADDGSSNHEYKCYISDDLNSIVLESPNESESIVYPAQNVEEALSLKSKLLGNK